MRLRTGLLLRLLLLCTLLGFVFVLYSHLFVINENVAIQIEVNEKPSNDVNHYQLISYENYQLAAEEAKRIGLGEQGVAVRLSGDEAELAKKFRNQNGFNIYISDKIATDRSIVDIRHPKCKDMKYMSKFPTVSVVIPVFEEHFSTLMRTVVTSFKRAPGLIKEIILVDDGSSRQFLKSQLDEHIAKNYPNGEVRVVRLPKRGGLITARIEGAKVATGEILVFLDSHCEPSHNWLPPLIDPIARDYRTVTCPFIDVIDADNFEYRAQDNGARGAFDWELYYKRLPKLASDSDPEKPFDSPVMAGGLFAISAKWFWELGGYDPGLEIWGGEQYELSFKLWMCGGRMIDIPCSRIGHIYRKFPTNFPVINNVDFLGRNYKRVAEVWMDEYKEYLYARRPHYRALDPGDLSEQLAIRKRLGCKSFKWFMTEVAFDLTKKYPLIEPIPLATGDIRPVTNQSLCVDALGASLTVPIQLKPCVRGGKDTNNLQQFELSFRDDIRPTKSGSCFDHPEAHARSAIILFACHGDHGNQYWELVYVDNDKSNPVQIKHVPSGYCMEADIQTGSLITNPCNPRETKQNWIWQTLQIDKAREFNAKAF